MFRRPPWYPPVNIISYFEDICCYRPVQGRGPPLSYSILNLTSHSLLHQPSTITIVPTGFIGRTGSRDPFISELTTKLPSTPAVDSAPASSYTLLASQARSLAQLSCLHHSPVDEYHTISKHCSQLFSLVESSCPDLIFQT
ncbi:uncharacterized protein DFL_002066 [Arthrobotrys flagrans]|uniref:Uncharacterized protein n=1 Tax=Arthrobotrys flagrans TaxID=97331 RepID=A0A437A9M2_ARTFL|nr:hypothetical protein DFL_002066 [Arthrobotrys flagrans]